jgi:hypothetical protein
LFLIFLDLLCCKILFSLYFNTLRTGDANLHFLCFCITTERQMTQICLLTCAWFLHT